MWLLAAVIAISAFVLLKYQTRRDKVKHFKGISLFESFFVKNIHQRIAALKGTKLACLDMPSFTVILGTHPDSAKVNN